MKWIALIFAEIYWNKLTKINIDCFIEFIGNSRNCVSPYFERYSNRKGKICGFSFESVWNQWNHCQTNRNHVRKLILVPLQNMVLFSAHKHNRLIEQYNLHHNQQPFRQICQTLLTTSLFLCVFSSNFFLSDFYFLLHRCILCVENFFQKALLGRTWSKGLV